jgi:hypothetical protein
MGSSRTATAIADEKILAALLEGKNVRETAEAVEMNERSVRRRLTNDAFMERLMEARSGMLAAAASRLMAGLTPATNVLHELLGHKDPDVKHRAAVKVIELAVKVSDLAELQRRMEFVERFVTQYLSHVPETSGDNQQPAGKATRTDRAIGTGAAVPGVRSAADAVERLRSDLKEESQETRTECRRPEPSAGGDAPPEEVAAPRPGVSGVPGNPEEV